MTPRCFTASRRASRVLRLVPAVVFLLCVLAASVRNAEAAEPVFGVEAFDGQVSADAAGDPFSQAGGHPYSASETIAFNTVPEDPTYGVGLPVEPVKDVISELPPGLVGNPSGVAQCSITELSTNEFEGAKVQGPLCPVASQVGVATLNIQGGVGLPFDIPFQVALYNMVPPPNVPVRFGFEFLNAIVLLDAKVRPGPDFGVTIEVHDASEGLALAGTSVTLWGVPADPSHDFQRSCPGETPAVKGGPSCSSQAPLTPFLRNPTSCTPEGVGLPATVRVDSWFHPGVFKQASFVSHDPPTYTIENPLPPEAWGPPQGPTGCDKVPFNPTITIQPTATTPDSPTGLNVDLSLPQPETAEGIGESDLRKAVVTLPEGMTVNPSQANGLAACSEAQIGLHSTEAAGCPDASKIGRVNIKTPLLKEPLEGSVYLAKQSENPFGSLLAVYLAVEGQGVTVKLAGRIEADPTTGRLTTTFDNQPQLPFSHLHLEFFGGPNAPLVTPRSCGTYSTSAVLTSWSGKTVSQDSGFTISQDGNGAACPPAAFAPSFTAGTTNPAAGAFSPFVLSFGRNDAEQDVSGLSFTMPPGVSAVLKGVARCSQEQVKAAEEGTGECPAASRIGSVTVGSGAGPDPYFLKGSVYLTGPYNGGPFGEAVVVPAVAGPFSLGNVVVRGSIRIDPHTAQPTVVSDPFPQFVKSTGIPTDVRSVHVALDRPGFAFNPTDCRELTATGTLTGAQGATANVSSRFEAANCATLGFKPRFQAATVAKTSRKTGASLHVSISYPKGAFGTRANIASVKVALPKQLPSELSTLQKACRHQVFEVDPAACPAGSRVGYAVVRTPLLGVPLQGPAYFVSHGGEEFPNLIMVLQGEGVTVELVGDTFIKKGVTTSTFKSTPDVPFETFSLTLPQGKNPALGANGNLCAHKLVMPTRIVAQNGAVIKQSTKIAVSGCPKHKAKRKRK